jgi:tRNA A37 threonylcarbamoyladenosine synthetase subunit TsaC/SUA5/YrdC
MDLKGISGKKKPLSILCKDVSTISKYTSDLSNQKWVFKLLKNTLPGKYMYVYMYIYMYIYMYTFIYIYIYVYI